MSTLATLFKYEFKKQFPIKRNKRDLDVVGFLLSSIVTIAIIGVFIYFLSVITNAYVSIKIEKTYDPLSRAYEITNLFYVFVSIIMIFMSLENMRRVLIDNTDKKILLRLPVKESDLFLSKFLVLLIKNYITAFLFILPINVMVFIALKPSIIFLLTSLTVWILFPVIISLFTGLLIVPYLKLIEFLKNKYVLVFILFTVLVIACVFLYILFLGVVQGYLETGYIKFLLNEKFVKFLQVLLSVSYPINCLVGILLGKDLLKSILIIICCLVCSVCIVFFITKKLYHITLYKNSSAKTLQLKNVKGKKSSVISALIRKEFISVSREPKYIFSYLVIATAMPILVFCCYTLLESLIINMLGITVPFSLSVFIILIFSLLTNTFCASNMSREGITLLKQKTFPITPDLILLAKVIFCLIISILSLLVSVIVLVLATSLSFWDGAICFVIGILFTVSQILIATKMDLKSIKLPSTNIQIEKRNSITIAKVICLGLLLAMVVGVLSLVISLFANGGIVAGSVNISIVFAYVIPLVVGVIYNVLSVLYYRHKLQYIFEGIVR